MSDDADQTLLQRVVAEVTEFLEHVRAMISDPEVRRGVLMDLGQPVEPGKGAEHFTFKDGEALDLEEANAKFAGIDEYLKTADPSHAAFVAALADLRAVAAVFKNAFNIGPNGDLKQIYADIKAEFGDEGGERITERVLDSIFQLLALNYLFRRRPALYWIGQPLGFLPDLYASDPLLGRLLAGAGGFFKDTPDGTRLRDDWLAVIAVGLTFGLRQLGDDSKRVRMLYGWEAGPGSTTPIADAVSSRALSVSVDFTPEIEDGEDERTIRSAKAAITLMHILAGQGGPGNLISFSGEGELQYELIKGWLVKLELIGASAFSVYLPESGEPVVNGPADAVARLTWEQKPDPNQKPLVLPIRGKTRLEFGRVLGSVGISRGGFEARLVAKKCAFVLESGDDELLKRGLKGGSVRAEFDLGIGYANGRKFIEGGATLQATLPAQRAIGPLELRSVTIGLRAGDQPDKPDQHDLNFETSITVVIKLGGVTLTLDRVGCTGMLDFGFGEKRADLDLDFKQPSGIGLKIDAGVIVGGGYIFRDPQLDQYAGILELKIAERINVKAIALLSRTIDHKPAFSLLLIITAEGFQPIALGMGFLLTGIGGIFGVDRSINPAALESGVKTGALDLLLFPKDPIGDAPRIVATAGAAFPPTLDRNLLGAMVRIAWGVGSNVTIDLAVILEFAGWSVRKIALLGKVRAAFPHPEKPAVQINLDLVGTIDRDRKRAFAHLAITAGRIGVFQISGEAAMLYTWGEQPNYVISVGGFNPRFQKPDNFPSLERVKFSLTQNKNLTAEATFYVAITSNSFQIGGSVDLVATKGKFTLKGGVGIDALIQSQQPCYAFDLRANLELLMFGEPIFAVRFKGSLIGDKPWTIAGKATFEIWIFDYTVDFSHTWGETEAEAPPPSTDIEPDIILALGDRRNWTVELPSGTASPVVLRGVAEGDPRLNPLGSLQVTQRIAPLAVPMTRCGNARLLQASEFRIQRLAIAGTSMAMQPVHESFAPAQFVDMSDDEKLGAPAFEDMQAGVRAQSAPLVGGSGTDADAEYVTSVFNPRTKKAEKLPEPGSQLGVTVKGIHRAQELFALLPTKRAVRLGKPGWHVAAIEAAVPAAELVSTPSRSTAAPASPPDASFTRSIATLHARQLSQPTGRARLHLLRTIR